MDKPTIYETAKGFHINYNAKNQLISLLQNPSIALNGAENKSQVGAAFIANGAAVLNRMVALEMIAQEDIDDSIAIPSQSAFETYMLEKGEEDGCHVIDSASNEINRVGEIYADKCPEFKDAKYFTSRVPTDFVTPGGLESIKLGNIGTKTRLVMRAPFLLEGVSGFQIKRTQYGPLGLGKVTWFDKLGLYKEFFMTTFTPITSLSSSQSVILGVEREYVDRPNSWEYKQTITQIPVKDLIEGKYQHNYTPLRNAA